MNAMTMTTRAIEPQWPAEALPLVVFPRRFDALDQDLAVALRGCAERHLARAGSILFRGFACRDAPSQGRFVEALGLSASQTTAATQLALTRPRRAWVGRLGSPASSTTVALADTREFYWNLPRLLRRRLQSGLRYARMFHDDATPWQDVFRTQSPAQVDAFARANGYSARWLDGGALRLERWGAAVGYQSRTGALFLADTIPLLVHTEGVAREHGNRPEFELTYRDGVPVEQSVIADLVHAYSECSTELDLEGGDVLLLDSEVTCTLLSEREPQLRAGTSRSIPRG